MSRPKKTQGGPDLFSVPKSNVLTSTRNTTADTCGQIAGIPTSLAKAIEALRDVEQRCERARAATGILDARQAERLGCIGSEMRNKMGQLDALSREIDAMIRAGIAIPVKEEMELV